VAHDFNNLLTIIRSSVDLLRRNEVSEEKRRRYVEAISETADRAAKLTAQLLAFARRQALKPEIFDAADRVGSVCEMIRTVAGSRIRLETHIEAFDAFIEADVAQFETACVNLAVNARDAMDGAGQITVRVRSATYIPPSSDRPRRNGEFVAVSIADTGHGIPSDKLPQIFEPFFTTKEVGKGTGLGLSQVYGFVKQSGGEVAVESEVGRGTTFTLYLPRAKARPSTNEASGQPAAALGVGRMRILVVEDNTAVGEFATQMLRDFGHDTVWAPTAEVALEWLESDAGSFDLVFSDVVMPGIGGIALGREIRRLYPDLPVVLTSGYSDVLAEEGRHGFELLQKPYSVEVLSQVLQRVVRHPATVESRA
jgi:CheY-like chemotaxis protein